eukprot:900825-Amphidinium_carterae.1
MLGEQLPCGNLPAILASGFGSGIHEGLHEDLPLNSGQVLELAQIFGGMNVWRPKRPPLVRNVSVSLHASEWAHGSLHKGRGLKLRLWISE